MGVVLLPGARDLTTDAEVGRGMFSNLVCHSERSEEPRPSTAASPAKAWILRDAQNDKRGVLQWFEDSPSWSGGCIPGTKRRLIHRLQEPGQAFHGATQQPSPSSLIHMMK